MAAKREGREKAAGVCFMFDGFTEPKSKNFYTILLLVCRVGIEIISKWKMRT